MTTYDPKERIRLLAEQIQADPPAGAGDLPPPPATPRPPAQPEKPLDLRPAAISDNERTATNPEASSGRIREPKAGSTTCLVPSELVRALRVRVAEARIAGRRATNEDLLNAALVALPNEAEVVLAALDQHRRQLNVGILVGDGDFLPSETFSARLTTTNRAKVERLVAEIALGHHRPVARKDLWALALARYLA